MNDLMAGVYVAVVEDNTLDDEAKIGISLKNVAGKDKTVKCRARIAALMAGDQSGCLFLPEKKDQVLVAFEGGVFEYPVIIGVLWSKNEKPPERNSDGKNNVKLIKTRGGNEIRLIDEGGKEKIEIISKAGKILIAGKVITLKGNVHITGWLDVGPEKGSKTHIENNQITGQLT